MAAPGERMQKAKELARKFLGIDGSSATQSILSWGTAIGVVYVTLYGRVHLEQYKIDQYAKQMCLDKTQEAITRGILEVDEKGHATVNVDKMKAVLEDMAPELKKVESPEKSSAKPSS
jgi:hypothetical protein